MDCAPAPAFLRALLARIRCSFLANSRRPLFAVAHTCVYGLPFHDTFWIVRGAYAAHRSRKHSVRCRLLDACLTPPCCCLFSRIRDRHRRWVSRCRLPDSAPTATCLRAIIHLHCLPHQLRSASPAAVGSSYRLPFYVPVSRFHTALPPAAHRLPRHGATPHCAGSLRAGCRCYATRHCACARAFASRRAPHRADIFASLRAALLYRAVLPFCAGAGRHARRLRTH